MREEIIGRSRLILADCLDILPSLKGDAIIMDPPFNAGRESIANDALPLAEWVAFCAALAAVCTADNILVEVGKNDRHMRAAFDLKHEYRWAITLNYTNAMRQGAVGYSNTGLVYWYGGGKCHHRYMDRIDAPLENTLGEFKHPSPKTTAHYKKLVEMFSPKGGIVIDPFMGSGTTGEAAVTLGRSFIGVEINEGYFDMACRRIEAASRQADMFIEPTQPKQEVLF